MGADLSLHSTADRLDYNISQKLALLRKLDPRSIQFRFLNILTRSFEVVGSSATIIPCSLLATIYFKYSGKDLHTSVIFFNLMLSLLVNVILIGSIKGIVRRKRPDYSLNDDMYLTHGPDIFSFPSGHAVQMFLSVRYLLTYSNFGRASFLPCGLCGLITFLRIFTGRHFLSDVVGGSIIGWYSFDLYTRFMWQSVIWF